MARDASHTSPSTSAAKTLRAKPSEMDCAISIADVPCAYCRTEPSGRVMLIIYKYDFALIKYSTNHNTSVIICSCAKIMKGNDLFVPLHFQKIWHTRFPKTARYFH